MTSANHLKAFKALGCQGTYDESKLSQVARVCDECYELYREDTVRVMCASKCFTTSYFTGCIDSIGYSNSKDILQGMVDDLSGQ
ncbi:hypothetical protein NPIL_209531 [Nephila pilipes]|uniref:Uncharacterized protein n=1 Tax=Nephila pilipes TaxID=299642 RepID=A0A8X6PXU4_NEPPI|nr:hypothetical protein NPIL_209531 [Nephila pilipes]